MLKALQLHYAQNETFTTQRASQNLILTKIYLCVNYLSWLSIRNSGDFWLLANNFNKSANGALQSKVWVTICHYSTVGNACVQPSHVCCCEMLSHLGWCTCLCCRGVCSGKNKMSFTHKFSGVKSRKRGSHVWFECLGIYANFHVSSHL